MKKSLALLALTLCLCFGASCRRSKANEKRYDLKGKVVVVDREQAPGHDFSRRRQRLHAGDDDAVYRAE